MKSREEQINEVLLELLTSLRKKRGYTLEALADLANIHRTTIGLLERGERNPTVLLALQWAKALESPLSSLIKQAESAIDKLEESDSNLAVTGHRDIKPENFSNENKLIELTGLNVGNIQQAFLSCYSTLDIIDSQLITKGSPPIAQLIERANLSSMVGNLLASAIVENSNGMYRRNRPHAYPDLISSSELGGGLELKIALGKNNPKGHHIKPGLYLVFRYVLGTTSGEYDRNNNGDTVWFWECRVGKLENEDFSFSSTQGDSGKTAVITTNALDERMDLIYFVPNLNPFKKKTPRTS